MAVMTNAEILKLIKEIDRDSVYHDGEIEEAIAESKNINVLALSEDETVPLGKHFSLEVLMRCLASKDYKLTENDVETLRKYNIFVNVKDEQVVTSEEDKGKSFVALSDFHGYMEPVDKIVDHYIDEYDTIYILGDSTDRGPKGDGTGSLAVLGKIKELTEKYPGKVVYIPGNHDEFLVGYAKYCEYVGNYIMNLHGNGGYGTAQELDELKENNPEEYNDLIDWLEKLPIQRVHKYNGKTYHLAHAFFDKILYEERPDYCLRDYMNARMPKDLNELDKLRDSLSVTEYFEFKSKELNKIHDKYSDMAYNVLWFRRCNSDKYYNRKAVPTAGQVVVIGHTRGEAGTREHDLLDENGNRVEVNCVDGGIAYNGGMLKYDGGTDVHKTSFSSHNNTAPKKTTRNLQGARDYLHNYIVSDMYTFENEAFDERNYVFPHDITEDEFISIIDSYEGKYGFSYGTDDYKQKYSMYKKIFAFDLIVQNIIDKCDGDICKVSDIFDRYLYGTHPQLNVPGVSLFITRERDTRFFATALNVENMSSVLASHNCNNVEEYIKLKTDTEVKGKVKIKTV